MADLFIRSRAIAIDRIGPSPAPFSRRWGQCKAIAAAFGSNPQRSFSGLKVVCGHDQAMASMTLISLMMALSMGAETAPGGCPARLCQATDTVTVFDAAHSWGLRTQRWQDPRLGEQQGPSRMMRSLRFLFQQVRFQIGDGRVQLNGDPLDPGAWLRFEATPYNTDPIAELMGQLQPKPFRRMGLQFRFRF